VSDPFCQYDLPVAELLRRHGNAVWPAGSGAWDVQLGGGPKFKASVRLQDDWLLWQARPGRRPGKPPGARRLENLLQQNGRLAGGAKFALDAHRPQVLLAAEIPLDDQIDLDRRIADACAGLREGRKLLAGKHPTDQDNQQENQTAPAPEHPADCDLPGLCEQAGWPFSRRAGVRLAVPLDVREGFHQALLEPTGAGGVRAWVELGNVRSGASVGRIAVAVLLLRGCGAVRMARAAASPAADQTAFFWEISWGDVPGAGELDHALASLSMACRLSAREVPLVQDESIARHYLTVRGWSSHR